MKTCCALGEQDAILGHVASRGDRYPRNPNKLLGPPAVKLQHPGPENCRGMPSLFGKPVGGAIEAVATVNETQFRKTDFTSGHGWHLAKRDGMSLLSCNYGSKGCSILARSARLDFDCNVTSSAQAAKRAFEVVGGSGVSERTDMISAAQWAGPLPKGKIGHAVPLRT